MTLPAVVTILDLPLATPLSSAAIFEAVQTTNSVAVSVGVSLGQIMTTGFGALPTGGSTAQVLAKSSSSDFAVVWSDPASFFASTAIPSGGSASLGVKMSSAANFGVFFGSGVPTLAAATGSLYLRSDGATATSRLYVNTNGSTTWTGVTTVS